VRDAWHRAQEKKTGAFHEASSAAQAKLTDLLSEVVAAGGEVHAVETYKGWMEIDSFEDYQRAWAVLR